MCMSKAAVQTRESFRDPSTRPLMGFCRKAACLFAPSVRMTKGSGRPTSHSLREQGRHREGPKASPVRL